VLACQDSESLLMIQLVLDRMGLPGILVSFTIY
jgi:hypothetical protein